jgi:hypothetical protein
MATQVSPGVVIKERELSSATIVGALNIIGAFATTFKKGPVGEITTISTERQLIENFGSPVAKNAEDWLIASEYIAYGGRLAVVRIENDGLLNAASDSAVLVRTETEFESGVGGSNKLIARSAGTWANNYKVFVVDRGADQVLTLADVPDTEVPVAGTAGVVNVGGVAKSVEVVAWDAVAKKLTVIFDEQGVVASVGDTWENGGTDVNITAADDWYSNTSVSVGNGESLALSAIGPRPGTSNFARQRYIYNDEVHVAVVDTATNDVVERLTYLSKLSDAKSDEGGSIYFKDAINLSSQFVYHKDELSVSGAPNSTDAGESWYQASSDITASAGSEAYFALAYTVSADYAVASAEATLSGGTDGTNALEYDAGEATTAYDLFLDTEATEIDFVLAGGSLSTESATLAKYQSVVGVATTRKDCIAVVSPFVGNQVGTGGTTLSSSQQKTKTLNFLNQISTNSYTILGSGIKYVYDRFNDTFRWIGTNGDLAGLCVRTSAGQFDWISPAGLNRGGLRSVIKLAWNPNKADRDELYQARINPIVTFPGTGTVLFGDKTALSAPSAFDRINVRRLFLNVERRVERASKGILFEQNDSTTRAGFAATVGSYLSEIQAKRGITDYLVVCDETNNTPEVVDRNEFVAEIFIKPVRSINYVTVTFTATRTGISFSEVVGTAG